MWYGLEEGHRLEFYYSVVYIYNYIYIFFIIYILYIYTFNLIIFTYSNRNKAQLQRENGPKLALLTYSPPLSVFFYDFKLNIETPIVYFIARIFFSLWFYHFSQRCALASASSITKLDIQVSCNSFHFATKVQKCLARHYSYPVLTHDNHPINVESRRNYH